jgi:predicted alpha/beta hydrolase family esterase
MHVLILPGFGGSGPDHWQSRWESANPSFQRVLQHDWNKPVLSEWLEVLEKTVHASGPETVLVAHSLACLLVAHWAATTALPLHGALLVAVPDPQSPVFPKEAVGFERIPQKLFPFPSILVASTNDPYGSVEYARRCASLWGSRFVAVGALGHINSASNLGDWEEGFTILKSLLP